MITLVCFCLGISTEPEEPVSDDMADVCDAVGVTVVREDGTIVADSDDMADVCDAVGVTVVREDGTIVAD